TAAGTSGALVSRAANLLGPSLVLALRNGLRRRQRLLLSLMLLAVGGATFMSGLNVAASSDRQLASGIALLGYDLEISLARPQAAGRLLDRIRSLPDVDYAEAVGISDASPVRAGEAPVSRTQKDGGHGASRLVALAPNTRF